MGAVASAGIEVASVAIKFTRDVRSQDGAKAVFNGAKSIGEAAFDATADVVAGKIGGAIGKKITRVA